MWNECGSGKAKPDGLGCGISPRRSSGPGLGMSAETFFGAMESCRPEEPGRGTLKSVRHGSANYSVGKQQLDRLLSVR
jgi:hypothetical protein